MACLAEKILSLAADGERSQLIYVATPSNGFRTLALPAADAKACMLCAAVISAHRRGDNLSFRLWPKPYENSASAVILQQIGVTSDGGILEGDDRGPSTLFPSLLGE